MKNIKLNESVGHLFHIINLNMRKRLEKEIKAFGLSSSHQFGVLLLLSKNTMSQKEISEATLADEPSTTRMLDRMIKKELINKRRSDEDKRKQVVYITEEGQALLMKILPIVATHNEEIASILEEEERKELFRLLQKIESKL
ncbi:MAG: Unknown protein [uncultured Sulfurovum sp.]|uniref:HTH marR-type domain-containing protein n=1 Tax=uncultured Sulfurovum sp. TaxID=269237 RepID=A0A6S6T8C6_9BACT|nr:MAG: Unknown protein [uncultured Sulfurovum sp.]